MNSFKNIFIIMTMALVASCSGLRKMPPQLSGLPLPKYSRKQLEADFDLLVSALKEAHTGLYVYATPRQFDSIIHSQRLKIAGSMNTLEFYNVVAPVVAFSKEDHCDISLPQTVQAFLAEKGRFMPVAVINLNEKAYIINDPAGLPLKRHELLEVNGLQVSDIYDHIFRTFASDGFIRSSKFRYLDYLGFAKEYAKAIAQPAKFDLVTLNPVTNRREHHSVNACSSAELRTIRNSLEKERLIKDDLPPATLHAEQDFALLTINTFSNKNFSKAGEDFKAFVKAAFDSIAGSGTQNLIIDIRENGGGTEGNEDYLFSFLYGKPYNKYKYVQASGFTYTFLDHTDYKSPEDRKELEADLREEHYLAADGRILRRPGIEPVTPPQPHPYQGRVYVLTSGWTYSGGAEFSSLMREHTNAIFVGEEVGGGYHGNTSGYSLELTLPNSGIVIDIPLLRFVLDVSDKVPFGRGVIPDHEVQPDVEGILEGRDTVMEFTLRLIESSKKK